MSWDKGNVLSCATQIGCWDIGSFTCKTHDISCLLFIYDWSGFCWSSVPTLSVVFQKKVGAIGKIQSKVTRKMAQANATYNERLESHFSMQTVKHGEALK